MKKFNLFAGIAALSLVAGVQAMEQEPKPEVQEIVVDGQKFIIIGGTEGFLRSLKKNTITLAAGALNPELSSILERAEVNNEPDFNTDHADGGNTLAQLQDGYPVAEMLGGTTMSLSPAHLNRARDAKDMAELRRIVEQSQVNMAELERAYVRNFERDFEQNQQPDPRSQYELHWLLQARQYNPQDNLGVFGQVPFIRPSSENAQAPVVPLDPEQEARFNEYFLALRHTEGYILGGGISDNNK
eukprot:Pompholyxophrys_punicea_v1_NODE_38_length_4733_cov_3.558572.p3 type:complete len:243 gc:universal NODE_38_length_4733_cov_3.558572:3255-2527(-)